MSSSRPRRILRIGLVLLAAVGALALLIVATPLTEICARRLSGRIASPASPILILLSAADPVEDMPSESSYWRCVYAVRAWRDGGFERIVISGKRSGAMKRFLAGEGVPSDRIVLEERSGSTRENALFTAALLRGRNGPEPVLLTSDYHMFRARKAFEKAGLPVLARPIPDAIKRSRAWYNRPAVLITELLEVAKIAIYRVRGWI